jgi:hypothetical protein
MHAMFSIEGEHGQQLERGPLHIVVHICAVHYKCVGNCGVCWDFQGMVVCCRDLGFVGHCGLCWGLDSKSWAMLVASK